MDYIALLIGVFIAFFIIFKTIKMNTNGLQKFYAFLLATFPLYYFVFALLVSDYQALANEVLVGLIFIFTSIIVIRFPSLFGIHILAVGFILHGFYDVFHPHLFVNSGTPSWWPEFCGIIDIIIGIYMLFISKQVSTNTNIQ